jgi:hypothetical protein
MNDDTLFNDISTSRKTEIILSGGGNSALVQFVNSNADSVVIPKGKKVIIRYTGYE